MLLKYLILSLSTSIYGGDLCNSCLTITKELKNNDKSLFIFFEELSTLCILMNTTKCDTILNNSYNYILNNDIDKICSDIGLCHNLSLNNYIATSPSVESDIFVNGNNLLGYNISIQNSNINYKLYWNITINETIKDVLFDGGSRLYKPNNCINPLNTIYYIMIVRTSNNNYYYNYTIDGHGPILIGNISSNKYHSFTTDWTSAVANQLDLYIITKYEKTNTTLIEMWNNKNNYNVIVALWSPFTYYSCSPGGSVPCCS